MARAFSGALGRLMHRTVPANVVRGFGRVLMAVGVALPWAVAGVGGWSPAVEPDRPDGAGAMEPEPVEKPVEPQTAPEDGGATPADEPASGTRVAEATALRPALVHVVGGEFEMGSPETEEGRGADERQHRVRVTGFDMCETEVTQAHYIAVMKALPEGCGKACGDTLPAYAMSWYDAVTYLDALSEKEGLRPCYGGNGGMDVSWDRSCDGYRLPTEAEWEFAARAGSATAYSFGDAPTDLCKYSNGGNQVGCDDGYSSIAPVGSFRAAKGNAWNLLDMHGNVCEWVWDQYDEHYGFSVEQLTNVGHLTNNPAGPEPLASGADQPPDPAILSPEEATDWAKKLFAEAVAAHDVEDFYTSVLKFEQAYGFAPDKHIFAFNIGQDAWELRDCARVKAYLELFLIKQTGMDDLRKKAQKLLARAEGNAECVPLNSPLRTAAPSGSGTRVLRGGAYYHEPRLLRSALRLRGEPSLRVRQVGFRCVRDARPQLGPSPA